MTIEFFNFLWIYFLNKCLFGFRIDTSCLPFSIVVRLIPLYKLNFWYNNNYEYDARYGAANRHIDLLIPYICDIILVYQV